MVTAVLFGVFFLFALMGVPLCISMGFASIIPLLIFTKIDMAVAIQRFFVALDSYSLLAAPFFIISGGFLDKGGVSKRLVNLANALVGWLPGGLAVVSFLACAFFGAISGSSVATVVAIGSIVVPAMLKEGYPMGFTLTTIASAGWLGIIVPPSIPMVLYGVSSGAPIGSIFMGGFIPGFMLAAAMSLYPILWGRKHRDTIKYHEFKGKNILIALKEGIWALGMPILILGGIYGGIFTPTEAAAVSILYGIFVGFVIYRELNGKLLITIVRGGIESTSVIMFCIASASLFGYVMTMQKIPQAVAAFILSVANTKAMFWLLVSLLLLVIGTFMDTPPAILIMTPILTPMLQYYDINMVHFGVVCVVNLGIGLLTPPVGMNLYVAANLKKQPVSVVLNRHLLAYLGLAILCMVLYIVFPNIVMWLPSMMK